MQESQPGALAELDDYLDGEWALGASVPGGEAATAARAALARQVAPRRMYVFCPLPPLSNRR